MSRGLDCQFFSFFTPLYLLYTVVPNCQDGIYYLREAIYNTAHREEGSYAR